MKPTTLPKILCVDDESDVLDALERALRRDFSVLKARSGPDALNILDSHRDVVVLLSDQRMPGMTGVEFLTEARRIVPDAVRALLSGQMDLADMVEAVNSTRIHRFILKPWDNDYLRIQMIEAWRNHLLLAEKSLLQRLAVTDPLTELANKRFFQETLKTEIERANRHHRPISLAMLDLDRFKRINDELGHLEGDRILVLAARRIQEQVRTIDLVARFGGEEFVVVMPDTDLDSAQLVGERIRIAFETRPFGTSEGGDRFVTISIGVACCPPTALDATRLTSAADRALNQAKDQGRNRTVIARAAP